MSGPATISVIAPIYGVELYIEDFLHSLLGQSYPYLQFVFVNDGTKDNSMSILHSVVEKSYSHLSDRILIVNKENGGLPAARRTGVEHATGDYVYHVDPDDWLSDGALAEIAEVIRKTGADVVYFNYVKEYGNRSSIKKERVYTLQDRHEFIRNMYNHKSYGTLCNKCVKRNLYTENAIFFPKYSYAEDCYVSVQLVGYADSLAYLDFDVYHYRKTNPSAITRQGRKKRKNEYAMNFLDLYEKYRDVPSAENPVEVLFDDILIQAGWYSIAYGLDLFSKFPYLADAICHSKIRTGSDVLLPFQLFTKIYSGLFKLLK